MSAKKKCKVSEIEVGDYLSRRQYLKVVGKTDGRVSFKTSTGFEFNATNDIVEDAMLTCHQFTKTKQVSQTELAQKLMESNGDIFTVCFDKQATEESVHKKLSKVAITDLADEQKLKNLAKALRVGEERILKGYLVTTEPILGRSKVVDVEKEGKGYAMRLVDHRTLKWLILDNTKYVLK